MKTLLKALKLSNFKVRNQTKTDVQIFRNIMIISKRPLKLFGATLLHFPNVVYIASRSLMTVLFISHIMLILNFTFNLPGHIFES